MRTSSSRRGVALIIALIILAGLLLLGLPFLFSQSESLAGSRSLAYAQATAVGLNNGEQLAAAAVATGMEHHLAVDGDAWTRQHDDLTATGFMQTGGWITDNIFGLDTSTIAIGVRQARSGAWIEDEHGKLNPNYLSPRAWTILLAQLNIQDWDDDQVLDSQDFQPDTDPALDQDGKLGLDGLATSNGDNDDGNDTGELAEALADVRFTLPGRRITHLDQLLLADPGHNIDSGPGSGSYIGPNGPVGSFGFRRPLTRAELDRLRPYLTLYTPAPGRDGLIDLGSVVAEKSYADPNDPTQQLVSYVLLDEDPYNFIRTGSAATWPENHDNEDYQFSRVHGLDARDYSTSLRLDRFPAANTPVGTNFHGRAMGLSAPPRVNVHHALPPIIAALEAPTLPIAVDPLDPSPLPFEYLGTLPADFFKRIDPLSTGVELPPIGIASKGVISVTAGAAAADQLGHVAAERHRRTVLQAVPTQIDLEERWRAQDEFHALTEQRFTSRMVTWPRATERIQDLRPDTALTPASADHPIGLGTAPMPSLATGYLRQRDQNQPRQATHLHIDFRVPFGADQARPLTEILHDRAEDPPNTPRLSAPGPRSALTVAASEDVLPDGLRLAGTFTWQSAPPTAADGSISGPAIGPLRPVNLDANTSADRSLNRRHVSFWFKPHEDWDNLGVLYPILDLRSPAGNLGTRIDGTAGGNELQNRLSVYFDARQQLLVTVIAPPIIEHTLSWGPRIPFDNLCPINSAHLDERCLGDSDVEPFAWLPETIGDGKRLSFLAPQHPYPDALNAWDDANAHYSSVVSRAFRPNTVVHLLKLQNVPGPSGTERPYFRKDRWSHFQLVLAGDGPGDVLSIVDHIVGQDVSHDSPASVATLRSGDRLTLPALRLDTHLEMLDPLPTNGGTAYFIDRITVRSTLGLSAEDLFPSRGLIRINDEYIAYESVSGNDFLNCQRAQRQNTETDGSVEHHWPLTQEHLPGSLVLPGGYRLRPGSGVVYGGGCTIVGDFTNGDPNPGPRQWMHWGRLDHNHAAVVTHDTDPTLRRYPTGSSLLPLRSGEGVPLLFPPRGIVRIQGRYLLYEGNENGVLQNVRYVIDHCTLNPLIPGIPPTWSNLDFPIPDADNPAPIVQLIGWPLTGANPLESGRYAPPTGSPEDSRQLQIRHVDSGRIEWVQYTHFAIETAQPDTASYVIFHDTTEPTDHVYGHGPRNRGQQRTDFYGSGKPTCLTPGNLFPDGSPAIPVQTGFGNAGHWIATGDVITLAPRMSESGQRPMQAVVRYAATDGLDQTGGNSDPDTKNEYFAFDHALPPGLLTQEIEVLAWPGWSGRDLTPLDAFIGERGAPPRFDLAAQDADPSKGVELALLSTHPEPIARPIADPAPAATNPGGTIDALIGGRLDGPANPGVHYGIISRREPSGPEYTDIARVGAVVEASEGIFSRSFGLVRIDGEVFAYRELRRPELQARGLSTSGPERSKFAMLIGRGLLDLTDPAPRTVTLGLGSTRDGEIMRPWIPVVVLPIGPVAQLSAPMVNHQFFTLDTGLHNPGQPNEDIARNTLDAPYVLICAPTGAADQATLAGLAGGARVHRSGTTAPNVIHDTEYTIAPWLRGLYHSNPTYATQSGDIVIGWWPRLASARPAVAPTGDDEAAPYHRSRRYAWAGFPMAMHGARFDETDAAPAEVTIAHDPEAAHDLLVIEARVAAQRDPNWTRSAIAFASGDDFNPNPLSNLGTAVRTSAEFDGKEVSGAELRVSWRYADTVPVTSRIDAIAEAGSRGPFISSAFLRWRAPMAILAVEEAH